MSIYRRIVVGLDLTYTDRDILKYVEFLSHLVEPEEVYFVHVDPNLVESNKFMETFGEEADSLLPYDEKLRKEIRIRVDRFFKAPKFKIHIEVLEGSAFEQLLHRSEVKKADLVVLGRKAIGSASGIVASKLIRKYKGDMLFVPEDVMPTLKHLLLPIDFSENSARVIRHALRLQSIDDTIEGSPVHVFELLPDHFKILRSSAQYEKILEHNAIEGAKQFLQDNEAEIFEDRLLVLSDQGNNKAKQINRIAHDASFDMIIIGAKGHSKLELLLVGSVTERLIAYCDDIPLLIIR